MIHLLTAKTKAHAATGRFGAASLACELGDASAAALLDLRGAALPLRRLAADLALEQALYLLWLYDLLHPLLGR